MLLKNDFFGSLEVIDDKYKNLDCNIFRQPVYSPESHYLDVAHSPYFRALIDLRHVFKSACDFYWGSVVGAKNIDLFMLTPSVSSPMGPGSDSEAVEIQFGSLRTYLVDSSQFGFEPILLNGVEKAYCYLPSMRGEDPDCRHINQFFHCEAEIRGSLDELTPIVEQFVSTLAESFLHTPNIIRLLSADCLLSELKLRTIKEQVSFRRVTFDMAVDILSQAGRSDLVKYTEFGRDITNEGELELLKLLESNAPVWVERYDRDRVPFYQKPDPQNSNVVLNADLLFPSISSFSFGGEVIGLGQRQDSPDEMYDSLKRQGVSSMPYEWYINLRREPNYTPTSGFGLGVERFIAWMLNKDDIKNVILYPRLKNIQTLP